MALWTSAWLFSWAVLSDWRGWALVAMTVGTVAVKTLMQGHCQPDRRGHLGQGLASLALGFLILTHRDND